MSEPKQSKRIPKTVSSLFLKTRISPNATSHHKPSKKLLEVLTESAERSSVHGFSSFASPSVSWPLKLLWLCFVLASWTYFAYQMNNSITSYFSYEVSTSSSILEETPTLFPGKFVVYVRFILLKLTG